MTFLEAKRYIDEVQKRGSIPGLGPVKNLLKRLGNPQNQLQVIHVAGTNGKGSICTFLEYLYRVEGKKVGRYISPTIHTYLERFQINGAYMEEEVFSELMDMVMPKLCEMEASGEAMPTAFEIETVIAFLFFLREEADLVILETGMGGRKDATNVVDHPLCTVFTSIGMDHMQFLGHTIEEITYEKAGIIKDGCPVVSYPNPDNIENIIQREMTDRSLFRCVDLSLLQILSEDLQETVFLYKGEIYKIRMLGEYQVYNAATAIETKLMLDRKLDKNGLYQASWEGRFEVVGTAPLFIKDGAHNVDGVKALKESLQKHFTNRPLLFIIGVLGDKEYDKMMQILCPLATSVYTITPPSDRGLLANLLRDSILPYCKDVTACDTIETAVHLSMTASLNMKEQEPVIVAWGSLSYIGQITKDRFTFL